MQTPYHTFFFLRSGLFYIPFHIFPYNHIYSRMRTFILLFIPLFLLSATLLSFSGCGHKPSPAEAMQQFSARYTLPAGRIFLSGTQSHEDAYLSPERFDLLYARTDGDSDREDVQEYAVFLGTSLTEVSECGIFLCPDRDAAFEVVGMLNGRIDTVRRLSHVDASHAEDAVIELYGSIVVYVLLPDNAAAIRTLSRILS